MGRNVISLIHRDHRHLDDLLRQAAHGRGSRRAARDELASALTAHLDAAEEGAQTFVSSRFPEAAAEVRALHDQGRLLREGVVALVTTEPVDEHYDELVIDLREAFDEHVSREDRVVSLLVDHDVDVMRLRDLGARYQRRFDALQAAARKQAPGVPRRLDLSRADLYEQARRAGIPGRSAMSREELIAALGAAGPPAR